MKYLVNIVCKNNGGTFSTSVNTLDEIREYAKKNGAAGDELVILRNGDCLKNAKRLVI